MPMKFSKRNSLFSLSIFVAVFFGLWALRVFFLHELLKNLGGHHPEWAQILSEFLRFVVWVAPVLIYLRFIAKEKEPLKLLKITTQLNWKWVLYFAPFFLFWILGTLYKGEYTFVPEMNAFVFVFFKILGVPVMEEILFRGFIQNSLLKYFSFAKSNVIQAFLFMCAHFAWIYFFGLTSGVIRNFASTFIVGLVLGFVTRKTNSILPGMFWHLVNNIFLQLQV